MPAVCRLSRLEYNIPMQNERIIIQGGKPLAGSLSVCGAKNSVLNLMAESIMAQGTTTISNVTDISDVRLMIQVLEHLGADVDFKKNRLSIDAENIESYEAPYELVAKMRASIAVLGPLVARFGKARVAMPGGCQIGSRKLDMHILGLEALGVCFEVSHGYINASVPRSGLRAARVNLEFPSVGTTENLMVAACAARGTTLLENVAREPEIVDLANFLNSMGAKITGQGSPQMQIAGVSEFAAAKNYRTVGDRIEAGTLLVAGALGGGPLTVKDIDPAHLTIPLAKLRSFGCEISTTPKSITISSAGAGNFHPTDIQTLPYPGFPTDLQAQFMVLAALSNGKSVITENIFENRFMFADELIRMGARISIEGHHALIDGVEQLSGAPVQAPDLRGGAALVLAGLNAEGQSTVSDIGHIDRGYHDLVGKLKSIGADITRHGG
jgi:UDP-N-acetylglucosamine 1-carboxyvinyltransferase